jgi:hypothetical protein
MQPFARCCCSAYGQHARSSQNTQKDVIREFKQGETWLYLIGLHRAPSTHHIESLQELLIGLLACCTIVHPLFLFAQFEKIRDQEALLVSS